MDMEKKMPRWVSTLLMAAVFWLLGGLMTWLMAPFVKGNIAAWLLSILLTVLSSGIPALIIRPRIGRTVPGKLVWASALGISMVSVQTLMIRVIGLVLGTSAPETDLIPSGALEWAAAITATCIVPGICEEGLFRGAIQESLTERFGRTRAVLITAGWFAVVHRSLVAFPAHFFGSVLLSLTLFHTGSLAACMCCHGFFNLTVMLASAFPGWWNNTVVTSLYLVWMLLLAVPLLRKLRMRRKNKP